MQKQADPPVSALPDPVAQQLYANEAVKARALGNVALFLGLGGATGIAGRALLGRRHLFGRSQAMPPTPVGLGATSAVPMAYPVYGDERDEERARRLKVAWQEPMSINQLPDYVDGAAGRATSPSLYGPRPASATVNPPVDSDPLGLGSDLSNAHNFGGAALPSAAPPSMPGMGAFGGAMPSFSNLRPPAPAAAPPPSAPASPPVAIPPLAHPAAAAPVPPAAIPPPAPMAAAPKPIGSTLPGSAAGMASQPPAPSFRWGSTGPGGTQMQGMPGTPNVLHPRTTGPGLPSGSPLSSALPKRAEAPIPTDPFPHSIFTEFLRRQHNPSLANTPGYDASGLQHPSLLRGDNAAPSMGMPATMSVPWMMPGAAAAGIGGVAGGWGLADWWLNSKRKADLEDEVEKSRQDYEQALIGQYDPRKIHLKTAAEKTAGERLGEVLDRLAGLAEAELVKQANPTGAALGTAGALALMLALGSGYAGYKWSQDRSQSGLLEEAYKRRERQRFASRPPEMVAVPAPVHLTGQNRLSPVGALPEPPPDVL